jgi:exosortase C (VPDSG-CTERM-specific)
MLHPPNRSVAQETIIHAHRGDAHESAVSSYRKKRRFWAAACFVFLLLVAFCRPLLLLANYAAHSELYSYILLVPIVSAYLLYLRRDQLPKRHVADVPGGTVLVVGGLGIFLLAACFDLAGRAPADNRPLVLLTLSFLCCLVAGGFFFLGRDWMRAAAFPLGFLIFMVPMPDAMADALETASKYASAEVANLFFHISGVPFLREGLIFQLPNITIEVAQECSGIRSSWVLFMTSILAANLFLKTPWRRFALVAFVIPLAILRNGFRILVIGLLCVHMGPQMIHSLIHRRGGPLFFTLSLIPLLLVSWLLRKGDVHTRQPK